MAGNCTGHGPLPTADAPPARMTGMSHGGGHRLDEAQREASPYIELDRSAWAALAHETESPLRGRRDQGPARPRRLPRPRGGRGGLPPAVAPAQPVRRVRRPAAPRAGEVPAPARLPRARRSSSASPGRWRSASRRPRACCSRCWPTGPSTPTSRWSPPTASSTPTPSSSGAGCCSARASPSPTTGARCCASSSTSSRARTRSRRRRTPTWSTTSCPTRRSSSSAPTS